MAEAIPSRDPVREPVAEVEIGETFVVETINFRTPVIRTPDDANPETYREREETGPIFIKGIQPGDVLRIQIENIRQFPALPVFYFESAQLTDR